MKIGLLSDTHGFLNPTIRQIFEGVALILHAGDIGDAALLDELTQIAPVKAVYGNSDYFPLTQLLSREDHLSVYNKNIYLTHHFNEHHSRDRAKFSKIKSLDFIVCGHTHVHDQRQYNEVWIINPGAAGRGGRTETPTVATLEIHSSGDLFQVQFYKL